MEQHAAINNKNKRQTIYSPIDPRQTSRLARSRGSTSPKLRYLDEDEDDDDEEGLQAFDREQDDGLNLNPLNQSKRTHFTTNTDLFEKCTHPNNNNNNNTINITPITKPPAQLKTQRYLTTGGGSSTSPPVVEQDQEHDQQERASLEEVYLCSCCGITRPLDPPMKYMPLFRGLFILFNLMVLALGLANLGMGLWFRIDPKVYEMHKYIETQNFTLAGWILLAGGFGAFLMALLGFSAVSKQSICLLVTYSVSMTILTVTFIGALVLLTVYGLGNSLERFMTKEIYEQIRRRTMSTEIDLLTSSDAAQFLDFVQVKLRCCGAEDFRDYQKLGMVIPTTCYTIAGNYINAPGCGQALRQLFDVRAGLATGCTAAGVIAQIVSTVLASLMACSIYNWRAVPRPASAASYSP